MQTKTPRALRNVPWVTPSGAFDPSKFPIDSVLRQALRPGLEECRSACVFLGSMVAHGRIEAGVYLLGLLRHYQNDLKRLEVIVESLCSFREEACAMALFHELRRVKASNATRRYLDQVIRALTHLPLEVVQAGFHTLAADPAFSYRMRAKFARAVESLESEGV